MKSWLAQSSSGRLVTLLPGKTFLHIMLIFRDLFSWTCAGEFFTRRDFFYLLVDNFFGQSRNFLHGSNFVTGREFFLTAPEF